MASNPNLRFIASQLRRLPIFAHMTPEQLDRVASAAQLTRADPGTTLVQQGQTATALLLLVSGTAALLQRAPNGYEQQVGLIGEGQHTSEQVLYGEYVEPYTVRVVESAVVLVLPKSALAAVVAATPEIRANVGMQQRQTRAEVTVFTGQRPDETIMHIIKRHWWAFARRLWLPLIVAAAMLLAAAAMFATLPWLALLLLGGAVLVPGAVAFILYADWQDDCLIITDQRLVKISDQFLQFDKTISEIPFERAYEVNSEIPPDPFARLFNYGTVTIRTAGTAGSIIIDTVPNPSGIQKLIFSQRDTFQQRLDQRSREAIDREIDAVLGVPNSQMQTPAPARRLDNPAAPAAAGGFNPLRTRFVDADGSTVYRRHLSIWLRAVFPALLVLFAGLCLAIASPFVPALRGLEWIGIAVGAVVTLFGAAWTYTADWDWRHDLLIVARESITIIHKRPFWLQNDVEQVRLAQVDNVVSEVMGIFNTLLNRGNVRISLIGGGSDEAKRFTNVGDPQQVQAEISRRLAELQSSQASGALQSQREAFAEYLTAYHQRTGSAGYSAYSVPGAASSAPLPPTQTPDTPQPPVRDNSRPPNIPRRRT